MRQAKALGSTLALALALLGLAAPPAQAVPSTPAWNVLSIPTPTAFLAGDTAGEYSYDLRAANIGSTVSDGSDIVLTDTLPAGVSVIEIDLLRRSTREGGAKFDYAAEACETETTGEVQTVRCTVSEALLGGKEPARVSPGEEVRLQIEVLAAASLGQGASLTNHFEVEGGGAAPKSITTQNLTATLDGEGDPEPAPGGFTYFQSPVTTSEGQLASEAASHPFQLTTSFALNTNPQGGAGFVPAGGDAKDISLALPPGLIGDPTATEICTAVEFATTHTVTFSAPGAGSSFYTGNACPDSSAVGIVLVQQVEGAGGVIPLPLYSLVPPPGSPALFGFQILNQPFYIDFSVRSGTDYGIDATLRNLTQIKRLTASTVIVWGDPGDPAHDAIRGSCLNQLPEIVPISNGDCPADELPKASLRLPTSCIEPLELGMQITNWTNPAAAPIAATETQQTPSGCNQVPFEPTLEARPTTDLADSPTGLHAELAIPQNEDPEGRASADLRSAVVTLPEGIAINPASANGLGACTPAQIGLTSPVGALPVQFTPAPSECPGAARIGTAQVNTPLLDHPIKGGVYVAAPHDNPFGSLLAIYIAANDKQSGVNLKLAGRVATDPQTGQITTTFAENPQQPFESFELDFFGGPGAALRTPQACGTYTSTSVLTPWSAPESGPPATPSDTYAIKRAPGGGACPAQAAALPATRDFDAGTEAPIARAYSPFVLRLSRPDGSQELSSITVSPPPGLIGRLAGIPYCPEAALATAAQKTGAAERAAPSCPAASRVGTVTVGAGAGPRPYYTQGAVYLAGPYKGAPLSFAVITPAAAGPYDLGTVVTRVALEIDPQSARITARADQIPRILAGIPLDVRSVAMRLDRPEFIFNPTNCDPMSFTGTEISALGQASALARRFQVAECGRLAFKPKLRLLLRGKTTRGGFPALRAVLTMPEGGANLARASVALPRSEFIEQAHFKTICTRVQYAARACPPGSIYGHVRAYSPVFAEPLRGPVYLRSSSNPLPDLVFSLDGQVHVEAVGRVDTVRGGIRTTFESVPDAPLSKVVLSMQGGKKGLFVNSRDICAATFRATAEFDAHSGKTADSRPALKAHCKGAAKKGKSGKGKKRASRAQR
jgi:hypothetical protein